MLLSHSAAISCLCSLRRSFHAPLRTHAICCLQKRRSNLLFSLSPAALPFDLSPPPIDLDPLDTVPLAEEDETSDTYADADEALDAVGKSAVVVDLSDYGRIRVGKIAFDFCTIKPLQTLNVLEKARDVTQFW